MRRINAAAEAALLPEAEAVIPRSRRLPGVNGKARMSKSGGNAIPLSASPATISAAVQALLPDPDHLRMEDPGEVEGNVVFAYLDAFDEDSAAVADLKVRCRHGGLGNAAIKCRLEGIL